MRLSKRGEYGIKAAVRLAHRHGAGYLQSREIAESEGLPAKFLESILLSLRAAGFLESKVGAGGGYRLARPPERILVCELISTLSRSENNDDQATPAAPSDTPVRLGAAALGTVNDRLDEAFNTALGSQTLAELTEEAESRADSGSSTMYYI